MQQHENSIKCIVFFIFILINLILLTGCDINMAKKPLTEKLKTLFDNPEKLSTFSKTEPVIVKNRLVKDYNINKQSYSNFQFTDTDVHGLFIENATMTNATFKGGDYAGLFFSDSRLTNVTFENITFSDAVFSSATLVDVTFKNCNIIDSLFMKTKGKVTFIDSDLDSVDFHEAQAAITLINSKVHSTFNPRIQTFTNQQPGASIDMTDTTLNDVKVGGTLTHFKATGGEIIDTVIGNKIKTVQFDNVSIDLAMVGSIGDLTVSNSTLTRFAIGEMKINSITIDDCQPSELLSLTDGNYASLTIQNCAITTFKPWSITANELYITDSEFQNTIMSDSKINQLTLKNVTFENGKFDNAMAKESDLSGVKLGGGEFNMAGSNIPLQ